MTTYDEFVISVDKVRKGDRIHHNDEWRTVTESRQYLGGPGEDGTYNSTPAWVVRVAIPDDRWDYQTYPSYGPQLNDNYDPNGPEYVWPYDCTEEISFNSWDDVVTIYSDKVEQLDMALEPIRWWVAVWEIDRAFGGQEEGGWWYDTGDLKQCVGCSSYEQAQNVREQLNTKWESEGNSSSVIYRGGDYRVSVHGSMPDDHFPERHPVYC
jgi:hypothetical protein